MLVVLCSDIGVGKSSFVNQLCHKEALNHSVSTVGCCVEVKVIVMHIQSIFPIILIIKLM